MSPERTKYYSLGYELSTDPFNVDNIFFSAIQHMGYPVRVDRRGRVLIRDAEAWDDIQSLKNNLYGNSMWSIFDSVANGGSNEISLLLTAPEHKFYELYPSVERKHPIRKATIERLYMRAYLQWSAYLERDPIAKHSPYPTEFEKSLYRKLKKKGVRPISARQMQNLLVEAIERIQVQSAV